MERRLVVVLEDAPLRAVTVGKELTLLHAEEHAKLATKKAGEQAAVLRPESTHQALLALFDSPLAKAGLLKVFVRTIDNVLIDVDSGTKIPRSYRRFAALFAQLLTKLKIRAVNSSRVLLKTVKNPVTAHLPPDTRVVGVDGTAELLTAETLAAHSGSLAVVISASGRGQPLAADYIHSRYRLSNYPLSPSAAAAKLTSGFEQVWAVEQNLLQA